MDAAGDTVLATAAGSRARTGVCVQAPARLHLGFLDPAGTLGRPFGSLGLVIGGPETVVELAACGRDSLAADVPAGDALARAQEHLTTLRRATGCAAPVALRLRAMLPVHAGLGSGTQLALAVGRAFCAAFDLHMSNAQLATLLGRGARSGVGIAGFAQGGLLLDGGPRADGAPAPLLARVAFPPAWRVVLVLDPRMRGLSGPAEKAALAQLPPLPRPAAADICHQVLMRVLPGAAAAEFEPFAAGVNRIQQVLGSHFAPAQGGSAFTSPAVARLLQWIAARAPSAIGQSSWGPAGFAVLPSEATARSLLAQAREADAVDPALDVHVVAARNHGALLGDARTGG